MRSLWEPSFAALFAIALLKKALKDIGTRMGSVRDRQEITQAAVARSIGRTKRGAQSAISRWESGSIPPTIRELLLYAEAVNKPIIFFRWHRHEESGAADQRICPRLPERGHKLGGVPQDPTSLLSVPAGSRRRPIESSGDTRPYLKVPLAQGIRLSQNLLSPASRARRWLTLGEPLRQFIIQMSRKAVFRAHPEPESCGWRDRADLKARSAIWKHRWRRGPAGSPDSRMNRGRPRPSR